MFSKYIKIIEKKNQTREVLVIHESPTGDSLCKTLRSMGFCRRGVITEANDAGEGDTMVQEQVHSKVPHNHALKKKKFVRNGTVKQRQGFG
jgi:hypothetical protein